MSSGILWQLAPLEWLKPEQLRLRLDGLDWMLCLTPSGLGIGNTRYQRG
jgi:hypothetical protein